MSKTRTGRKGRARLAAAEFLNNTSQGAAIADALLDADLLNVISGAMRGEGDGGALFSEGQLMGPLPDAVFTEDGAPNMLSGNETGGGSPMATDVVGETTIAADANHTGLAGTTFKHHYFQHKAANAAAALVKSQAAPLTSSRGILYLPSGPAADFVPANHGAAATEAYAVSIRPDLSELYAKGVTLPNIRYTILGDSTDTLAGKYSVHSVAKCAHLIKDEAQMTAAAGAEIRVKAADGTTLSILFKANGFTSPNGGVIAEGAAETTGNFIVESATQLYVLDGSSGEVDTDTKMAQNIKAAVAAWNDSYGTGFEVAQAGAVLTWSNNMSKGVSGNGGADGNNPAAAHANNTVTAYITKFDAQQPIDGASGGQTWFGKPSGTTAAVSHVPFGIVPTGEGANYTGVQLGVTEAVPFGAAHGGLNATIVGDKYKRTDLDLTVTIGANSNISHGGLVVVWSLD